MAINKNHEFEDLDGVKCAIVEKNVMPARVEFLKKLLELNGYSVVVVKSPPPKATAVKAAPPAATTSVESGEATTPPAPLPETYTVGVTDVMFNPTNALFGRLLKTASGHIVSPAYWEQMETVPHDDVPYYESKVI